MLSNILNNSPKVSLEDKPIDKQDKSIVKSDSPNVKEIKFNLNQNEQESNIKNQKKSKKSKSIISHLKIPFLNYFNEINNEINNEIGDITDINNELYNKNSIFEKNVSPTKLNKIPTPKVFRSNDYTLIDQITLNELDNLRIELKEGVDFKLLNFKDQISSELDIKIKNEFKKGIDWEIDNFKNELKKTTFNFQKNNHTHIDNISWKTFSLSLFSNSILLYIFYKKYLKI